jgi:DNA-binding GntR family transcriptional regulator
MHAEPYNSQTGRVLLSIRELVLKGEFKPGKRVSELGLPSRVGASRTQLRRALDRLAQRRQGARAEALVREHTQLARRNLETALHDEAIRDCVPGGKLILIEARGAA